MSLPDAIVTPRLVLRPGTPEQLRASVGSAEELCRAAGCEVAADWPPLYWDPGAIDWILARIAEQPGEAFWRPWLVRVRTDEGGERLVGTAGFKGPPGGADSETAALVEIGYSVVTSHWRRGIASEAVGALLDWAGRDARVRVFRAHTLAGDPASGGVLLRNGFVRTGTISDPEDGEIDRYEREARART